MNSQINWIEIARRALVCLLIAGALTAAQWPAPALLRLAPVDLAAQQKREFFADDRQLPLEAYVAQKTAGRLVTVEGSRWADLLQAARATSAGNPPDDAWARRRGQGWLYEGSVFFRLDEAPLNEISGALTEGAPFAYLALAGSAPAEFLGVTLLGAGDVVDGAPAHLAFPWRRFSVWLALLAAAIYALLPRAQHPPEALTYSRLRAVVLPDLLGFLLFGMFFALPVYVIPRASPAGNLFDVEGGWIWLTAFTWLMAAFGLVILGVAAWYAAFELLALADRLRVTNLFRRQEVLYRDMVSVSAYTIKPPRWLMVGGLVVSLFNWRALGPTLAASRERQGLEIVCHDGQRLRVSVDALAGLERLHAAFQQHGVTLTPEAQALLSCEP